MFSPRFIITILWVSQIALHVVLYDLFFVFDEVAWYSIIILYLSFILGTFFIEVKKQDNASDLKYKNIQNLYRYFLKIYFIAAVYGLISLYDLLVDLGGGDIGAGLIRQMVINDFMEDRVMYNLFRIFYLGVGFSIFIISFSKFLSLHQLIIIFSIGLISAIATTGRLYILLFFVATSVLMYKNKIISKGVILIGALIFIILFFSLAIVFEKGGQESVGAGILWNAQVYLMSSVACFNDYVITGNQAIEGGAIFPNPVRTLLSSVGFNIPNKPSLLPFASVPIDCNTYTILFPLLHDGGLIGVLLGGTFLGIFHQYLFVKYKNSSNPLWWYLYAISLYPLVMSIFEDAYFSSPGFWMLLWVPPITYVIFFANQWRIFSIKKNARII